MKRKSEGVERVLEREKEERRGDRVLVGESGEEL